MLDVSAPVPVCSTSAVFAIVAMTGVSFVPVMVMATVLLPVAEALSVALTV